MVMASSETGCGLRVRALESDLLRTQRHGESLAVKSLHEEIFARPYLARVLQRLLGHLGLLRAYSATRIVPITASLTESLCSRAPRNNDRSRCRFSEVS